MAASIGPYLAYLGAKRMPGTTDHFSSPLPLSRVATFKNTSRSIALLVGGVLCACTGVVSGDFRASSRDGSDFVDGGSSTDGSSTDGSSTDGGSNDANTNTGCLPENPRVTANPCPEGQYQDLSASPPVCRDLQLPDIAFSCDELSANLPSRSESPSCSESEIKSALQRLENPSAGETQGGTLNLPGDCTITLDGKFVVRGDNIVVQGNGPKSTVFEASSGHVVEIDGGRNVVLRDFAAQGTRAVKSNDNPDNLPSPVIVKPGSTNVLIERLELRDGKTGIYFYSASQVTVRYVDSGYHYFHGVSTKECYSQTCYGPITKNYSIYSNETHHSAINEHGIDSHASYGEVAGNYIHDTGKGAKLPETQCVWFHHNKIVNANDYGLKIYPITENRSDMVPKNIAIYDNVFEGIGHSPSGDNYAIQIDATNYQGTPFTVSGYWLLRNSFSNLAVSTPILLRHGENQYKDFHRCAGGQETFSRSGFDLTDESDCDSIEPATFLCSL